MKTSLSRMFVLGAVGWVGVMTGVGCKTDVGDPGACRAAESYLPTWSKEHTSEGHSAFSNVRCEAAGRSRWRTSRSASGEQLGAGGSNEASSVG